MLQIETLQQENNSLKKQAQKFKEQFLQQKVRRLHSFYVTLYAACSNSERLNAHLEATCQSDSQLAKAVAVVGVCIVEPDGRRILWRRAVLTRLTGLSIVQCCFILH